MKKPLISKRTRQTATILKNACTCLIQKKRIRLARALCPLQNSPPKNLEHIAHIHPKMRGLKLSLTKFKNRDPDTFFISSRKNSIFHDGDETNTQKTHKQMIHVTYFSLKIQFSTMATNASHLVHGHRHGHGDITVPDYMLARR